MCSSYCLSSSNSHGTYLIHGSEFHLKFCLLDIEICIPTPYSHPLYFVSLDKENKIETSGSHIFLKMFVE